MQFSLTGFYLVAPQGLAPAEFHQVLKLLPGDRITLNFAISSGWGFGKDLDVKTSARIVAGNYNTDFGGLYGIWDGGWSPSNQAEPYPEQKLTVFGGQGLIATHNLPPDIYTWGVSIPSDVGIAANLGLMTWPDRTITIDGEPSPDKPILPYVARITVTVDNPNRNEQPKLPPTFTPEDKEAFLHDAESIEKLTRSVEALKTSLNPETAVFTVPKWFAELATGAISQDIGFANTAAQTVLALIETAEEVIEDINPVTLVLGLTEAAGNLMRLLLLRLHDDPPDANFTTVFAPPAFTLTIPGASAAGQALVANSFKLLSDYLVMLTATERSQGAQLAGDPASQALQIAAFGAAMESSLLHRGALSADLAALHQELVAGGVADADLGLNSLAATKAHLAAVGLADPFIANLIQQGTSLIDPAAAQAEAEAAIAAIAAGQAAPASGSAFAALDEASASLRTLNGGAGNDYLPGTAAGDLMAGHGGDDAVVGGAGADRIYGNLGRDFLFGADFQPDGSFAVGSGNDTVNAGDGNDAAWGGDGDDLLRGDMGDDALVGGAGADSLDGGEGDDFLFGGDFSAVDGTRLAGSGNDTLAGGAGRDALYGFDGDDVIGGGAGNEYVEAGEGADGIEGGADADTLLGQEGADTIHGGAGFDYIYGDAGADLFVFKPGDSFDTIWDFSAAEGDKLQLDPAFGIVDITDFQSRLGGFTFEGADYTVLDLPATGDRLTVKGAAFDAWTAAMVLLA